MPGYVGKTYVVPDEHQEFFAEYRELLTRYPKAAARFALADLGDNHARIRIYETECIEMMGITICEAKERPQ